MKFALLSLFAVLTLVVAHALTGTPWGGAAWPLLAFSIAALVFVAGVALARRPWRATPLARVRAAIVAGVALRLFWIAAVRNEPVSDFAVYHELGVALSTGAGYALTGPAGLSELQRYLGAGVTVPHVTALRPPGTAFVLAALYAIAGPHPVLFKLLNVALEALIIALLAALARRAGLRGAVAAAWLWALYPSSLFATNLLGSEILFTAAVVLTAWLFATTVDDALQRRWIRLALAGLGAALSILVRSMSAPLAASAVVAAALRGRTAERASRALVVAAALALGLAPWALRNWRVFHAFIPVCTFEGEFLGRHTLLLVPESLRDAAFAQRIVAWRAVTDEVEKGREGYAIASENWRRMLRGGPRHIAASLAQAVDVGFGSDQDTLAWATLRALPGSETTAPPRVIGRTARFVLSALADGYYLALWLAALAGLAFFVPGPERNPGFAFLGLFFLAGTAAIASVVGEPRYHFGLMPFVILLAGHGLASLARPRADDSGQAMGDDGGKIRKGRSVELRG
jgi:hypothetical protein